MLSKRSLHGSPRRGWQRRYAQGESPPFRCVLPRQWEGPVPARVVRESCLSDVTLRPEIALERPDRQSTTEEADGVWQHVSCSEGRRGYVVLYIRSRPAHSGCWSRQALLLQLSAASRGVCLDGHWVVLWWKDRERVVVCGLIDGWVGLGGVWLSCGQGQASDAPRSYPARAQASPGAGSSGLSRFSSELLCCGREEFRGFALLATAVGCFAASRPDFIPGRARTSAPSHHQQQ